MDLLEPSRESALMEARKCALRSLQGQGAVVETDIPEFEQLVAQMSLMN